MSELMTFAPGAKPARDSISAQGLAVLAASVIPPSVLAVMGFDVSEIVKGITDVTAGVGFLWALYGNIRRADVRWPWQRELPQAK